jgi:hypothetical protein
VLDLGGIVFGRGKALLKARAAVIDWPGRSPAPAPTR